MLVRSLTALFFGCALFLTLCCAVAEIAFRLNPDTALRYPAWMRTANLARFGSPTDQLRVAVNLNPRLSSAWIQLGLDAEVAGNLSEAEADLLQAARVDHLYLPAWTLANFYFRRGDADKFWPWAERAARLTFDDYRPLLRLADAMDSSPQRAATRLGSGAPLLRAYLDLLIQAHRVAASREIARMLEAYHDPADQARLAVFRDGL